MGYNDIVVGRLPEINLPRSKFKMPFNHKTSFLHGDLVPIHAFEVNTGDGFSLNLSSIIRMSTPIVPIMDTIKCYIEAFAVPKRLLWTHWKEFNGENKGSGYQQNTYVYPAEGYWVNPFATTVSLQRSLSYALGKPIHMWSGSSGTCIPISVLKERAYYEIWNTKFRAAQLQACMPVDYGDGAIDSSGVYYANVLTSDYGSSSAIWGHTLLRVNKMHDYFVDSTLSPQYAAPVTLPLGTVAPVGINKAVEPVGWTGNSGFSGEGISEVTGNKFIGTTNTYLGSASGFAPLKAAYAASGIVTDYGPLVVDLTNATAATVNELRYAFSLQRFAERENFSNNLYRDILAIHYGVKSPDATMQLPEHLGGYSFMINVNQVTSQAGYASGVSTVLGEVGATSTTVQSNKHIFTKSFTEPCIVMVFAYTKHKRTYSQGVAREDLKYLNKFEWMWPEFLNIGDRKTLNAEIYASNSASPTTLNNGFGFQDSWAEDKYFNDIVTGLLNPSIPAALGSNLGYWSLADSYSTVPSLSSSWIQENRDALTRCLKTGANGPDFIADFYFDYTASRIGAIRKMPGLIDHTGLF